MFFQMKFLRWNTDTTECIRFEVIDKLRRNCIIDVCNHDKGYKDSAVVGTVETRTGLGSPAPFGDLGCLAKNPRSPEQHCIHFCSSPSLSKNIE